MPRKRALLAVAAMAAGAMLSVGMAAPALAQDETATVLLNQAHAGSTAEDFDQVCEDQFFAERGEYEEGWHFVLPGNAGDAFVSITLVFDTPDGETTIVIPQEAGFIREDQPMHAYLFTPAGWTLLSRKAEVEGTPAAGANFNVSHTCAGVPTPTPTPTVKPTPTPTKTEKPDKNGLPITGAQVGGLLAVGASLLIGGSALLLVRRRRDINNPADN